MEPMLKRLQKPSGEDVGTPLLSQHVHALASGFLGTRKGRCSLCLVRIPGVTGCSAPTCHRPVQGNVLQHCSWGSVGAGLWEAAHGSKVCTGVRPH